MDKIRSAFSAKRRIIKLGLAALMASASSTLAVSPAFASDQTGTVTKVAFAGGRFLFWLSGNRTGTVPGCDCCRRWEIDGSAQAQMSVILTAFAQGKSVTLSGSGACVGGSNDTEGVNYFEVS